jgi:tagatose-1,6-bisphosphate aldolase non-catalytic subunit AgaZ/GatZ
MVAAHKRSRQVGICGICSGQAFVFEVSLQRDPDRLNNLKPVVEW